MRKKLNFNTKKEMIELLAEKREISKVKAKEMVEDVLEVMEELIKDETHDGLDVYGMFRAEVTEVPEKERRNPSNGTTFMAKAHNAIKFKASSRLKNLIK